MDMQRLSDFCAHIDKWGDHDVPDHIELRYNELRWAIDNGYLQWETVTTLKPTDKPIVLSEREVRNRIGRKA